MAAVDPGAGNGSIKVDIGGGVVDTSNIAETAVVKASDGLIGKQRPILEIARIMR